MSCQLDAGALRQAWRPLHAARLYASDAVHLTVTSGWVTLATPRATASLPCTSERPFTARAPAQRFGRLFDRLPPGLVRFSEDEGDLVVQAGTGTFRFYAAEHKGDAAKAWRASRGLPERA